MNLLEEDNFKVKKPKKAKKVIKYVIITITFFMVSFLFFSSQVSVTNQSKTSWLLNLPIINHLKKLAESADRKLKGEDSGRINILLLGMGGKYHEGGYLTDTIILASLDLNSKKIALVSIPRDTAVPLEGYGWRKINNINAYAEVEKKGSGGMAISQALNDVLNIPIDYYLRIDFEGFTNIVDHLGGVKINVENTLDDYKYPVKGMEDAEVYGDRYEHLHFDKGWQDMDGNTALKYARSRHAAGAEGSDFARARRQQIIILAVKEKLLSFQTFFKPKMVIDVLSEVNDHVSTNLQVWEIIKLWDMFKDVSKQDIINRVLDNSPNGLLVDSITKEGAYMLFPRSGDFSELEYLVNNIFSDPPQSFKQKVVNEMASVEIRNGTWINGLATRAALDLEKYGFNVVRIGNSSKQNFQKTVIYDLSYGGKTESLSILKNKLNANVSFGMPDWLIDDLEKDNQNEKNPIQPDYLIILGQDADASESGADNPDS